MSRPRIEFLVDRPDLLEKVAQMHQREWGHLTPRVTLADRMAMLRECRGHGEVPSVFLATSERDGLLGTALLVENDMESRSDLTPWLAGVYVRAHYRLRGVATLLVKAVTESARAQGLGRIYLHTLPGLEHFYEHRGWRRCGLAEHRSSPVVIMSRTLDDGADGA